MYFLSESGGPSFSVPMMTHIIRDNSVICANVYVVSYMAVMAVKILGTTILTNSSMFSGMQTRLREHL